MLLRDAIDIPTVLAASDFVIKIDDGVEHAQRTIDEYVVTDSLAVSYGKALDYLAHALETSSDQGAFVHGSFGSGKSHFMAVLNLLLAGNTQARTTPELADVVARHSWTEGRKFLLVPYHMIGARDMESAILGQYADFVRKQHPAAPVPGFYLAEGLFKDARSHRRARSQILMRSRRSSSFAIVSRMGPRSMKVACPSRRSASC